MALSDRQHDAFDKPAKAACREGNLRVLREAAYLLWEDSDRTRLRCDWCELMGATGLLTLDLLKWREPWRPAFLGACPVPVHDLHATLLYLLGIDHKITFKFQGRDFRLTAVHGNEGRTSNASV